MAQYRWSHLRGTIPPYELAFLLYLCYNGVKEANGLLGQEATPQNTGYVEAFQTMRQYRQYQDFVAGWHAIMSGIEESILGFNTTPLEREAQKHQEFYWRLCGQKVQFEFVLDRMLICREAAMGYRFDTRPQSQQSVKQVVDYLQSFGATG